MIKKQTSSPASSRTTTETTTILITGAQGQLGQCFQQLAGQFPGLQFRYLDVAELDITNRKAVFSYFSQHVVHWCINCAAFAAVDKAEGEPGPARLVNTVGARNLAQACAAGDIPLIHFSTDYVYHGRQNTPIRESDPVSPKGVYARTKMAGDRAVLKAHSGAAVIRTSWLYAPHGQNFVKTILRYCSERPEMNVVYDQVGTPTYAPDLAEAVLQLIQRVERGACSKESLAGIWHYSNEGVCSWYDFAIAIKELAGLPCQINPIETSAYPLPAPRPPYSVLSKEKIKNAFELAIPYWRDSLQVCLEKMGKGPE
ncbi:MAG: dTDP-4-dehydrorhamnose reductase [Bacteroidetes bacterium]|nr:MAG: dTDP-4-dehydrorhamnose reductase [Bacteroidota bacterium]